jgi:hypothetical protein
MPFSIPKEASPVARDRIITDLLETEKRIMRSYKQRPFSLPKHQPPRTVNDFPVKSSDVVGFAVTMDWKKYHKNHPIVYDKITKFAVEYEEHLGTCPYANKPIYQFKTDT